MEGSVECFLEGNFKNGLSIISTISAQIEQFKNQIDPHHVMLLYYKIACLHFGCDQYEEAIVYLNKIVNNKKTMLYKEREKGGHRKENMTKRKRGLTKVMFSHFLSSHQCLTLPTRCRVPTA